MSWAGVSVLGKCAVSRDLATTNTLRSLPLLEKESGWTCKIKQVA